MNNDDLQIMFILILANQLKTVGLLEHKIGNDDYYISKALALFKEKKDKILELLETVD
jgi:hypothetical protein